MSVIDIGFVILLCAFLICMSLIIQIIKLWPLQVDIRAIRRRLNAIEAKINRNKDHTDRRILRINSIMDSNISGYERYGEAIKQNTDKINILVDRVNKITKGK